MEEPVKHSNVANNLTESGHWRWSLTCQKMDGWMDRWISLTF